MNPRKFPCSHEQLRLDCSGNAIQASFQRPDPAKRRAALTRNGRQGKGGSSATSSALVDGMTFPAPLVLPGDDLALSPDYPPQSFKSWLSYNKSMPVTSHRNTIYVVPPPDKSEGMQHLMQDWAHPKAPRWQKMPHLPDHLSPPNTQGIRDYLSAFYHGMKVEKFNGKFRWQEWEPPRNKGKDTPSYIGLATPGPDVELVGIRHRPSLDGIARQQLNLNDILDALIDRVPSDAYAIVMLVDEDLYEDDEDDFCCGRAYGASRIAIVSSFRYNPCLDGHAGIDHDHMWPASHCSNYVDQQCTQAPKRTAKRPRTAPAAAVALDQHQASPLPAAIQAASLTSRPATKDEYEALWFSRVGRTVSHELGHCLGLDHCVYFACVMQGTAGMAEDVRQPPYLCPVCLQKVSWALAPRGSPRAALQPQKVYVKEQYEDLRRLCERFKGVGMFAGWDAWIAKRLEAIEGEERPVKAGDFTA